MAFRLPWQKSHSLPTILHVTHIKAGSSWFHGLLKALFGTKVMPRFGSDLFKASESGDTEGDSSQHPSYMAMFQAMEFRPGFVYPAMFITKGEFDSRPEFANARRFVMIRDLRDTFTSHYFSLKNTHATDKLGRVRAARDFLATASQEEGFRYLFDRDLDRLVDIQRSWLQAGELVVRYEDMIGAESTVFTKLFIEDLQLPVTPREVEKAVEASSFEKVFRRKLGEVDQKSHGRQGLPGDWKNHFSKGVREEFHKRVGDLLVEAGYEKDDSWTQ
jgi:hypothetical protein